MHYQCKYKHAKRFCADKQSGALGSKLFRRKAMRRVAWSTASIIRCLFSQDKVWQATFHRWPEVQSQRQSINMRGWRRHCPVNNLCSGLLYHPTAKRPWSSLSGLEVAVSVVKACFLALTHFGGIFWVRFLWNATKTSVCSVFKTSRPSHRLCRKRSRISSLFWDQPASRKLRPCYSRSQCLQLLSAADKLHLFKTAFTSGSTSAADLCGSLGICPQKNRLFQNPTEIW